MYVLIIFLSLLVNLIISRDFYVGMFKRNDFLVAQDRLYKERVYNSRVIAKYGRIFTCPITYFRIADRLGIGRGPNVRIIRGGLRKKYVVVRLVSVYNYPISVNIYVGCENKISQRIPAPTTTDRKSDKVEDVTTSVTVAIQEISNITDASTDVNTVDENSTIANNNTSVNKTE